MRTNYKNLILGVVSMVCTSATAQVSAYIFSQTNGTYTPISGGTLVAQATSNTAPGNLAATTWNLPSGTFPFPFIFNGNPYTGCDISCNGYITFGTVPPGTGNSTPISSATGYAGAVSAWARVNNGMFNIGNGPFYTSEVRVETLGAAPNRTVVIQWDNWRILSDVGTTTLWIFDYQIRLSESTNAIHIVYGPGFYFGTSSWSTIGFTSQVGLRGPTNTDFNNRMNPTTAVFGASTPGTANNSVQNWAISASSGVNTPGMPVDGLTYKWEPPCNISLTSVGGSSGPNGPVICSGQSMTLTTNAASNYTWSTGNTTTTSIVVSPTFNTSYSIIGTSTANCLASAVINVGVSAGMPTVAINTSTNQVCLGKAVLLTASGALTYTWTGGVTNGVAFVPSSTNNYTVTGQNGCGTATAVTAVTVAPLAISAASSPSLTCASQTAVLNATVAATSFTWAATSGTVNPPTSSLVVNPTVTTVYTLTASDGTCSATSTVALNVNPAPIISIAASSSVVCTGGPSATLTASGNGTGNYTWTPGGTGNSIVVFPTSPQLYQVATTSSLGCPGSFAQVVVPGTPPPVLITAGNLALCLGDGTNLSASGATSYSWANGPVSSNYSVTPTQPETYTVTAVDPGFNCPGTATVLIDVFTPSISITGTTTLCEGETTTLTAGLASNYVWNPGGHQLPSISVTPLVSTTYSVSGIGISGSGGLSCPVTATVLVTVNPSPSITASGTPSLVCKNETVTLTGAGAASYVWANSGGTVSTNASATITSSAAATLIYTLTGTGTNNCKGSTIVVLNVSACNGMNEAGAARVMQLAFYPNPNNGAFTLESTFETELAIVNELGQVVKRVRLSQQSGFAVSVTDLAAGVYVITGSTPHGSIKEKMIVTK